MRTLQVLFSFAPVLGFIPPCDDGWIPFKASCYKSVTDFGKMYSHARDKCIALAQNSDTVSIHADDELTFLIEHFSSRSPLWIGLSKQDDLHWQWSDGMSNASGRLGQPPRGCQEAKEAGDQTIGGLGHPPRGCEGEEDAVDRPESGMGHPPRGRNAIEDAVDRPESGMGHPPRGRNAIEAKSRMAFARRATSTWSPRFVPGGRDRSPPWINSGIEQHEELGHSPLETGRTEDRNKERAAAENEDRMDLGSPLRGAALIKKVMAERSRREVLGHPPPAVVSEPHRLDLGHPPPNIIHEKGAAKSATSTRRITTTTFSPRFVPGGRDRSPPWMNSGIEQDEELGHSPLEIGRTKACHQRGAMRANQESLKEGLGHPPEQSRSKEATNTKGRQSPAKSSRAVQSSNETGWGLPLPRMSKESVETNQFLTGLSLDLRRHPNYGRKPWAWDLPRKEVISVDADNVESLRSKSAVAPKRLGKVGEQSTRWDIGASQKNCGISREEFSHALAGRPRSLFDEVAVDQHVELGASAMSVSIQAAVEPEEGPSCSSTVPGPSCDSVVPRVVEVKDGSKRTKKRKISESAKARKREKHEEYMARKKQESKAHALATCFLPKTHMELQIRNLKNFVRTSSLAIVERQVEELGLQRVVEANKLSVSYSFSREGPMEKACFHATLAVRQDVGLRAVSHRFEVVEVNDRAHLLWSGKLYEDVASFEEALFHTVKAHRQ